MTESSQLKILITQPDHYVNTASQKCSIEYLTTEEKSWTTHKISIEYLTSGLLSAFKVTITARQLTFLTHPA